ncbi:MAG: aminodeoxychorismate synthase component I [Lentisphaerae bacterium]|nr:aminodeoxychorismate synthase component I [Lentisphaerota bacterium]
MTAHTQHPTRSGRARCLLWGADEGAPWRRFDNPVEVVAAHRPQDVWPVLQRADAAAADGLHAVGFVAYEAAPGLDAALTAHAACPLPLVWFGFYRAPAPARPPEAAADARAAGPWTPSVTRPAYRRAIASIKGLLRQGDTYQVNYTFRLRAPYAGPPEALFARLAANQRARHAAYIETDAFAVCSASPELFFKLDGDRLESRPMKGTAPRGATPAADRAQARSLRASAKNRAENVMIVDMLRNDMGRIARPGSVTAGPLFTVEAYPTVWQMTSTVRSRTDAPVSGILRALFPCASVTGAPKVRTMQIIQSLEPDPRGVYTGCLGVVSPGRRAEFSVAIRTACVDRAAGRAEYGVGGGIVWDSRADAEYAECADKARVLG